MLYVEAPNDVSPAEISNGRHSLFLAGGITGCPDWQAELRQLLEPIEHLVVFNPRRRNFPISDPSAAEAQIAWEYKWLSKANDVLFWFSRGSDNPIVLFEYGKELGRKGRPGFAYRQLFVGCDPEYSRRKDVEIQTRLAARDIVIASSLKELVAQINFHLERWRSIVMDP